MWRWGNEVESPRVKTARQTSRSSIRDLISATVLSRIQEGGGGGDGGGRGRGGCGVRCLG